MRTTKMAFSSAILPTFSALLLLLNAGGIFGAEVVEVKDFLYNPNGTVQMFEYVPSNVQPSPALVVVMHRCGGSINQSQQLSDWTSLADQKGFILVFPQSVHDGNCFDVYSEQGLKRDGGSDSSVIVSMVQYEIQNRNVNPQRVFATGFSSGGMMTNVLLAEYPDVFAAGAAFYAGPYTCFATVPPATVQLKCAHGEIIKTAQEWGDRVRAAYPTFLGARPRMQLWHGTNDSVVYYPVMEEEVKQWTNVHALNEQPWSTELMTIEMDGGQNVTALRARYNPLGSTLGSTYSKVEAITLGGVAHGFAAKGTINQMVAAFFGL